MSNAQKPPKDYDGWREEMRREERRVVLLVSVFALALVAIVAALAWAGVHA